LLPDAVATTPPRQAAAAPQGNRLLFVDNLRILLISMVLVVHLDDTYGAIGSWYYHDPGNNLLTGILLSIPNAIGMGFFFLLAGYFTPGPYDRKGPRSFLRDRLVRLGIPVLIYGLLLDPLVVYIASGLHGNYWSFYANYLPQVRGVTGPAWFIALLLLFSLAYAGWRGLSEHRMMSATTRNGKLPSYRAIAVFIVALGLVTFVERIWWPAGSMFQPLNVPAGYLPQYISLYILGLIAYRRNWFLQLSPRMAKDWSLIALMAMLLIFGGFVVPPMLQAAGAAGTQQAGYAIAGGALSAAQMGHRGAHHHPALLPDQPLDPQDSLGQPSVVKNNTWLAGTCVGRSKNPGVGERTTAHAPREESARLSWKHLAYYA